MTPQRPPNVEKQHREACLAFTVGICQNLDRAERDMCENRQRWMYFWLAAKEVIKRVRLR